MQFSTMTSGKAVLESISLMVLTKLKRFVSTRKSHVYLQNKNLWKLANSKKHAFNRIWSELFFMQPWWRDTLYHVEKIKISSIYTNMIFYLRILKSHKTYLEQTKLSFYWLNIIYILLIKYISFFITSFQIKIYEQIFNIYQNFSSFIHRKSIS